MNQHAFDYFDRVTADTFSKAPAQEPNNPFETVSESIVVGNKKTVDVQQYKPWLRSLIKQLFLARIFMRMPEKRTEWVKTCAEFMHIYVQFELQDMRSAIRMHATGSAERNSKSCKHVQKNGMNKLIKYSSRNG